VTFLTSPDVTLSKSRDILTNKNLTALLENIKNVTRKNGKYVFSGSKPLKSIKTSFHKAERLAGIDKRFRFHDLRHIVASRLVTKNGADLIMAA